MTDHGVQDSCETLLGKMFDLGFMSCIALPEREQAASSTLVLFSARLDTAGVCTPLNPVLVTKL